MSKPNPAGRRPAADSAKKRGLIIRVVVWGSLAIMAVITLLDVRSRVAAQGTRDAWIAAQDEKIKQNKDLHRSDLEPLIEGSPSLPPEEAPADRHQTVCRNMLKYTWPGVLRSYTIRVYLGLGDDPSVEFIEGPGKVEEADGADDSSEQLREGEAAEPGDLQPDPAEAGSGEPETGEPGTGEESPQTGKAAPADGE